MMKKLFATAALTASAAAALASPAHADDHWTATGTAKCASDLAVFPALKAVSPLPLQPPAAPACGGGSLLQHKG
ncbi:hypothetical protein OIB37_17260 [Streptomyces sp. NBC_00820]|uniref:hypothetical protein n=1 Tax=Streptomyces sp. NBC_00820 TaxID=2975842 RepID=UPI002ED44D02|nr:hypothetical protein OIB37_17260 [Streptomyces sp. NBC_00820]